MGSNQTAPPGSRLQARLQARLQLTFARRELDLFLPPTRAAQAIMKDTWMASIPASEYVSPHAPPEADGRTCGSA